MKFRIVPVYANKFKIQQSYFGFFWDDLETLSDGGFYYCRTFTSLGEAEVELFEYVNNLREREYAELNYSQRVRRHKLLNKPRYYTF